MYDFPTHSLTHTLSLFFFAPYRFTLWMTFAPSSHMHTQQQQLTNRVCSIVCVRGGLLLLLLLLLVCGEAESTSTTSVVD